MEHPSGKENSGCIASLKDSMNLQHLLAKHQREIEMLKRVKETELHRALCKFTKQNNQLISENSKLRDQKRKGLFYMYLTISKSPQISKTKGSDERKELDLRCKSVDSDRHNSEDRHPSDSDVLDEFRTYEDENLSSTTRCPAKRPSKYSNARLSALEEESSDESNSGSNKSRPALQDIHDYSLKTRLPSDHTASRSDLFGRTQGKEDFKSKISQGSLRSVSSNKDFDMEDFYPPRAKPARRHSIVSYKEPSLGGKLRQVRRARSFISP
eukprot:758827-Hanusia_phi.AAC.10